MQMEQLLVKNFGPIPSLDISLSRLTIFIGEQSSGKSTIAKLLTIFRDVEFWYSVVSGESNHTLLAYFHDLKISSYFKEDTCFQYTYQHYKLNYAHNIFSFEMYDENNLLRQDIENIKKELRGWIDLAKVKLDHNENDILFEGFSKIGLYIPAERTYISTFSSSLSTLVLNKVPIPKSLLEFASYFDKAKAKFETYHIPFLGMSFGVKNQKEIVTLTDSNTQVPFDETSSGIQSIIPIAMVIEYCLNERCFDSFVVEEPELNLFPTNQVELLYLLIQKTFQHQDGRLVITTHSPYTLAALNNLILAKKLETMQIEEVTQAVNKLIPVSSYIDEAYIRAYAIGNSTDPSQYCTNLIDPHSGMISINYLDTVSEVLSEQFNTLYSLYIKHMEKK